MTKAPQGVIGERSALKFHGLLEEAPSSIKVFVPHASIQKRKVEERAVKPLKNLLQKIYKKVGSR